MGKIPRQDSRSQLSEMQKNTLYHALQQAVIFLSNKSSWGCAKKLWGDALLWWCIPLKLFQEATWYPTFKKQTKRCLLFFWGLFWHISSCSTLSKRSTASAHRQISQQMLKHSSWKVILSIQEKNPRDKTRQISSILCANRRLP